MGEPVNKSNDEVDKQNKEQLPNGNHSSPPNQSESNKEAESSQTKNSTKSGKSGFRFGRLKEDPEELRERAVAVCDSSVVIGNPLFMKGKDPNKKATTNVLINKNIKSAQKLEEINETKPVLKKSNDSTKNDLSKSKEDANGKTTRALIRQKSSDTNDSNENSSSSSSDVEPKYSNK